MDSDADGVSEFLLRVRELGDKRDREDEERARRLEQEIIAGREARRARRDERARSLSPQKDSPVGTPTTVRSFVQYTPASEVEGETHTAGKWEESVNNTVEELTEKGAAGMVEDGGESSVKKQEISPPTGPLSWQRRPKSNSTVLSSHQLLAERHSVGGDEEGGDEEEVENRRSQIVLKLGSKDPSWFKQTADRGATSGALRKAQDEGMDIVGRMALPGMSPGSAVGGDGESSPEPTKPLLSNRFSDEALSSSRFPPSTYRNRSESLRSANRVTSSNSSSAPGPSLHARNLSLSSTSSVRFEPPGGRDTLSSGDGSNRPIAMSPSQGRISPERRERTPSPTKGLGSFVQSAMLKREGSINKRWSNSQQPGTLSRNSSTASNRPTYPTARDSAPANLSREPSPALEDISEGRIQREPSEEGSHLGAGWRGPATERPPKHPTGEGTPDPPPARPFGEHTPPSSPTKTFDQKRWSPTKSSWLESALKKGTESSQFTPPVIKPLVKPHREPPLRVFEKRLPEVSGTPLRPPANPKPPNLSPKPSDAPSGIQLPQLDGSPTIANSPSTAKPGVPEKPAASARPTVKPPISSKPPVFEKQPPKMKETLNLRAGLRSRPTMESSGKGEELPFLNAMSRLRSVKTQNYAAPNELKESILAGKANLQTTGGPQRNKGPDPVKETLLSAKGSLKRSNSTTAVPLAPPAGPKPRSQEPSKQVSALPEGLEPGKKGSALAGRFNPNLANLLQRGRPGMSSSSSPEAGQSGGRTKAEHRIELLESGGALIHMTKNRARGPKRRAPTTDAGGPSVKPIAPRSASMEKGALPPPVIRRIPSLEIPEPPSLSGTPAERTGLGSDLASKDETPVSQKGEKTKPPPPAKSPLLRSSSNLNLRENTPANPSGPLSAGEISTSLHPILSKSPPRVFSRDTQPLPNIFVEGRDGEPVGSALANWIRPMEPPARAKAPIRLPKRSDESMANESRKISPTTRPEVEPEPAPVPAPPQVTSETSDSSRILVGFFKGLPASGPRVDLDVMAILSSNSAAITEGVRTLKAEVSEITGYGKLRPIPQEQNNVFFDESMYVCLHDFETAAGKAGQETYFWSGDEVSEATVEDAQLFARKLARENGGKLIRLGQGRETPSFFEALGGVIITRRGSRSNLGDGHAYALCGRSFMGNIVFDEVDCKASSLCSGFPFIVSSNGKVFLWKGKGSTLEELGVARLIAYDIPGGEVLEIEENKEPAMFFDVMEGSAEDRASADYWHLKPSCKSYATRLFKVDLHSRSKLVEISPFRQSDLDASEIYVVDAFFELYIVLGATSQHRRAEFQLALQFAQEYAILAVSVNDRPFIPVSSVILGGAPREFKALFRNWENSRISTAWQPSRKPSLRIVGLSDAMEAMEFVG